MKEEELTFESWSQDNPWVQGCPLILDLFERDNLTMSITEFCAIADHYGLDSEKELELLKWVVIRRLR